jgi:hypothetical protein
MSRCTETETHCEFCGSTDGEDVNAFANDGYSTCCNEIIVRGVRRDGYGDLVTDCRNHHGER